MGVDLETEFFLDLSTGTMTPNAIRSWDLAFECAPDRFEIHQNGGKFIVSALVLNNNFEDLNDTAGLRFKWDSPSGSLDSTAFGAWFDPQSNKIIHALYVIDRGVYEKDPARKFIKLELLSCTSSQYKLRYAYLNGLAEQEIIIPKIAGKNWVYLGLNDQATILDPEPLNQNWDLRITHYRHIYFELKPQTPYLVAGVLLNPYKVSAHRDSIIGFDKLDITKALTLPFQTHAETIGFDWKGYDVNQSKYTIRPDLSYLIKDAEGLVYKLRFLDYYDSNGQRGVPKFEYRRL